MLNVFKIGTTCINQRVQCSTRTIFGHFSTFDIQLFLIAVTSCNGDLEDGANTIYQFP